MSPERVHRRRRDTSPHDRSILKAILTVIILDALTFPSLYESNEMRYKAVIRIVGAICALLLTSCSVTDPTTGITYHAKGHRGG